MKIVSSIRIYPPDVLERALVLAGLLPPDAIVNVPRREAHLFATRVRGLIRRRKLRRGEAENTALSELASRIRKRGFELASS